MAVLNLMKAVREKVEVPFEIKWHEAQGLIARNLVKFERCVVAFSGGKDSAVVLYLVRQLKPDIEVVFCNTGVEYPETYEYINFLEKEWNLNLIRLKFYKKSFWDCVKEYGLPSQKSTKRGQPSVRCCYYLKERPMQHAIKEHRWQASFDGITASENRNRMFWAKEQGSCFFHKKWKIQKVRPILWWTEEEVWQFIKDNGIPYNSVYDKGCVRCGCMPCTAFLDWRNQLRSVNPRMYKMINKMSKNPMLF